MLAVLIALALVVLIVKYHEAWTDQINRLLHAWARLLNRERPERRPSRTNKGVWDRELDGPEPRD